MDETQYNRLMSRWYAPPLGSEMHKIMLEAVREREHQIRCVAIRDGITLAESRKRVREH